MLIVANWKAYVTGLAQAKKLVAISKLLSRESRIVTVLAPPAPFLSVLSLKNTSRVLFAAQDVSVTTSGAQTGEVPAAAYAAAGATYSIVGHSERRALGETDALIGEKLVRVLAHGLTPILCVGEPARDGEGRYLMSIREQITAALTPVPVKERVKIVVAYEPLWAIGKTAEDAIQPNDLAEMTLYIRKVLAELLPGKSARRSLVLYGGSVEPENIRALAAESDVDGFLIGHASVEPDMFKALVRQLQ